MTRYRVLADFKGAGSISHATPIDSHLDDFGLDFWFVGQIGVIPKKTPFTGVTAVSLCAFGCSAMPLYRLGFPTMRTMYCFKYHLGSKIHNQHV